MFDIYLNLFIASFDLEKNRICVVSKQENVFEFPNIQLTKDFGSITAGLSKLFEQNVDMSYGWTTPLLIDVSQKENVINITYVCKIPPGTELKNAYYISTNLCVVNSIARKAMAYV